MFPFRKNGEAELAQDLRGLGVPPPNTEAQTSFADKMLRSTFGIGMADMQRIGSEAQAMVARFEAQLAAIAASCERIEQRLAALEGERDARPH